MKNKPAIIYATSNPGKVIEISRHFRLYGLPVGSFGDFVSTNIDPDENGSSLEENAKIKALAYAEALGKESNLRGQSFVVVADDTGIFIDGIKGEPGIKVRRWLGYKMTDEEIINHCLKVMEGIPVPERTATFKTVLCLVTVNEEGKVGVPQLFEGTLKGWILEKANHTRIEGFPFESLFWVIEYDLLLGDLHRLSDEEKKGKFNHRERALEKVIPVIKEMVS